MTIMDQAQINRIAADWAPALQSGNVEQNLAFFTADAVIAGGDGQRVCVGLEEVRNLLEEILGGYRPTQCSLEVRDLEIHGDWAELRGLFQALWEPWQPDAEPEQEESHYLWVLKRQPDDSWKIARFLFYPAG